MEILVKFYKIAKSSVLTNKQYKAEFSVTFRHLRLRLVLGLAETLCTGRPLTHHPPHTTLTETILEITDVTEWLAMSSWLPGQGP